MSTCMRMYLSAVFFVDTFICYILMLLVMTFNVWVCLSLVLGLTIGYSIK